MHFLYKMYTELFCVYQKAQKHLLDPVNFRMFKKNIRYVKPSTSYSTKSSCVLAVWLILRFLSICHISTLHLISVLRWRERSVMYNQNCFSPLSPTLSSTTPHPISLYKPFILSLSSTPSLLLSLPLTPAAL